MVKEQSVTTLKSCKAPVHKRYFSTLSKNLINNEPSFKDLASNGISPEWVTGLIDAEGCFHLGIIKRARSSLGWEINPAFRLALDKRDLHILELLKSFLGVGTRPPLRGPRGTNPSLSLSLREREREGLVLLLKVVA
jgi:hypothetical protein